MDGQTELRWLRRATAVAAVARKNASKFAASAERPKTSCFSFKGVALPPDLLTRGSSPEPHYVFDAHN